MRTEDAVAFFTQLGEFSKRWLKRERLTEAGSPHGDDRWRDNHPSGAVVHYTADPRLRVNAEWFCSPESGSSAHVLICPTRVVTPNDPMYEGLPLLRGLPATVVQMRAPSAQANHATWANSWAYGIENVHTGEVRRDARMASRLVWWPQDWTAAYSGPPPLPFADRLWQPYTLAQMQTNAIVLDALRALWMGRIDLSRIYSHEQVQGIHTKRSDGTEMKKDKRDMGPLWSMHALRGALAQSGMQQTTAEQAMRCVLENKDLQAWAAAQTRWLETDATQGGLDLNGIRALLESARCKGLHDYLQMLLLQRDQGNNPSDSILKVWAALYLLGYPCQNGEATQNSLDTFATMRGLARRQPLSAYFPYLAERLVDRLGAAFFAPLVA